MVFESFITYSVSGLTASGKGESAQCFGSLFNWGKLITVYFLDTVREDLQAQAAGLTKVIAAELQLQLVLIDSASQEPQLWRYTSLPSWMIANVSITQKALFICTSADHHWVV